MFLNKNKKEIEETLKEYNENYANKHPDWAEQEAQKSRMFDEMVASEAVRTIWSTLRFEPYMQAREIGSRDYLFGWRMVDSDLFALEMMNKLSQDENTAKQMLSEDIQIFSYGGPSCYDEAKDVLVSNLMKSKFIHFQITQNNDGGFDAYAVFRIKDTARTVIIRICK